MKLTETEIQALKAQEAKDLAVQLLHQLETRDRAPVTAGLRTELQRQLP
jgi:hypothetical protein